MKSVRIKIKQHPEWTRDQIFDELKKAYYKDGSMLYLTDNGTIIIIPTHDKPIKMIYEGE